MGCVLEPAAATATVLASTFFATLFSATLVHVATNLATALATWLWTWARAAAHHHATVLVAVPTLAALFTLAVAVTVTKKFS